MRPRSKVSQGGKTPPDAVVAWTDQATIEADPAWPQWERRVEAIRDRVAGLIGADRREVAFVAVAVAVRHDATAMPVAFEELALVALLVAPGAVFGPLEHAAAVRAAEGVAEAVSEGLGPSLLPPPCPRRSSCRSLSKSVTFGREAAAPSMPL